MKNLDKRLRALEDRLLIKNVRRWSEDMIEHLNYYLAKIYGDGSGEISVPLTAENIERVIQVALEEAYGNEQNNKTHTEA
jgi:hypothetical protein